MWDLEYQETKENGGKWKPIVVSSDRESGYLWILRSLKEQETSSYYLIWLSNYILQTILIPAFNQVIFLILVLKR